jgi:hypothetical protein
MHRHGPRHGPGHEAFRNDWPIPKDHRLLKAAAKGDAGEVDRMLTGDFTGIFYSHLQNAAAVEVRR